MSERELVLLLDLVSPASCFSGAIFAALEVIPIWKYPIAQADLDRVYFAGRMKD